MQAEEIRCPRDRRKMFAKVRGDVLVREGNVIEVACPYCRKVERDKGEDVDLVLHLYNLLGECLGTEVL